MHVEVHCVVHHKDLTENFLLPTVQYVIVTDENRIEVSTHTILTSSSATFNVACK